MTLEYFQICNCFGFKDSGKIDFSSETSLYTILGKNSSGKTSVINAIEAFEYGKALNEAPRFHNFGYRERDGESILRAEFKVSKGDLVEEIVAEEIGRYFLNEVGLTKSSLESSNAKEIYDKIREEYALVALIANKYRNIVVEKLKNSNYIFYTNVNSQRNTKPELQERIGELSDCFNNLQKPDRDKPNLVRITNRGRLVKDVDYRDLIHKLESRLFYLFPRIYKFSHEYSLQDILPDNIREDILKEDEGILFRLVKLLGKDDLSEYFESKNPIERKKIRERIQKRLDAFSKKVAQTDVNKKFIKFIIDVDEGIQLTVMIEDKQPVPYRFLSENTQFLIAYVLWIYEHDHNFLEHIILFDEPDKGFHSSAQKELLRFLKDLAKNNTIIFSTHSEYLIDSDNLEGVKIMEKDGDQRPFVRNNWWRADSQPGNILAIEPIKNAIGLKFGQNLSTKNNIIVLEEVSAMFYLKAFQKILNLSEKLNFFPLTGDNKIVKYIPFLISQELKFKIVLDKNTNQQSGNPIDILVEKFVIDKNKYIFEIEPPSAFAGKSSGIEDLFSKSDFQEKILESLDENKMKKFQNCPNSEYVKSVSKGVMALKFYNMINCGEYSKKDFDDKTIGNFERLVNFCLEDSWYSLEIFE